MRGRNGNSQMRCQKNHGGRTGFCRETVDRLQLHHFVAERANDAPTARRRSRAHYDGAGHFYPKRDLHIFSSFWRGRVQE